MMFQAFCFAYMVFPVFCLTLTLEEQNRYISRQKSGIHECDIAIAILYMDVCYMSVCRIKTFNVMDGMYGTMQRLQVKT